MTWKLKSNVLILTYDGIPVELGILVVSEDEIIVTDPILEMQSKLTRN